MVHILSKLFMFMISYNIMVDGYQKTLCLFVNHLVYFWRTYYNSIFFYGIGSILSKISPQVIFEVKIKSFYSHIMNLIK